MNLTRLRRAFRASPWPPRDVRGPVRTVGGGWRFVDPAPTRSKDPEPLVEVPATITTTSKLTPE